MRFFRSTWLQRILPFTVIVLLSVGLFGVIEQQRNEKDDFLIRATGSPDKLSSSLRQLQIKYGFDVIHISVVAIFKKIILEDYTQEASFDPLSADFLTYPNRSPPNLITIL
jgi:hypothetical protein